MGSGTGDTGGGGGLRDASRGDRLQKVMAEAGVASRRACEELILEGHVEVNGVTVTELPAWADPARDEIRVKGQRLLSDARHVYVMLNKPSRCVTTLDDPGGRRTVGEMVRHPSGVRLFPVGRLDFETTGLLLMTNDGEMTNQLTHPRFGVPKCYRAVLRGKLDHDSCLELEQGVFLASRSKGETVGATRTMPVQIRFVRRDRDKSIVEITLKEGKNRQIRRMLAKVGYPVKKLTRVSLGPLQLRGLAPGAWRELTTHELRTLRNAMRQAKKDAVVPNPAQGGGRNDREKKQ
ncbi:MAG: pseudouridine synthase [Planctomycetota bacterium]|jgi:pseudouridine synthase